MTKMKNKTATECWNILRGELDSAIDSYVPMTINLQLTDVKLTGL